MLTNIDDWEFKTDDVNAWYEKRLSHEEIKLRDYYDAMTNSNVSCHVTLYTEDSQIPRTDTVWAKIARGFF